MFTHPLYIDPNTGGIVAQMLIAILAGATGFLLIFSRKIREAFAKMRRGSKPQDEEKKE